MYDMNVKKKPTIRELTSVVLELNNRSNAMAGHLSELEKAFSLYVEMNKHDRKFSKFIEKKVNEWRAAKNDSSKNEVPDKSNLQGDTDGEGAGTKRVRKKKG